MTTDTRTKAQSPGLESRHTPGPWTTGQTGHTLEALIIGGDLKPVCKCYRARIEAEANARLIAAAPELLAALNGLFKNCGMIHKHWGDGCNQAEADAAITAAQAAIAKAKGVQP